MDRLDGPGLDLLFRTARTAAAWNGVPVADQTLREVYGLMRLAPTSANCAPARILFLRSQYAKQRLLPALSPGNIDRTMAAPVVAILGYDPKFYDQLPRLYPAADARAWFSGNPALAAETALRNATLQGGYMILAARALGLDCAPMSGFDRVIVDHDILADYQWKSNFLLNLGYADNSSLPERGPRLEFEQACVLL